jgi:hypothetical protein
MDVTTALLAVLKELGYQVEIDWTYAE